jgi:hypothetical protein
VQRTVEHQEEKISITTVASLGFAILSLALSIVTFFTYYSAFLYPLLILQWGFVIAGIYLAVNNYAIIKQRFGYNQLLLNASLVSIVLGAFSLLLISSFSYLLIKF